MLDRNQKHQLARITRNKGTAAWITAYDFLRGLNASEGSLGIRRAIILYGT